MASDSLTNTNISNTYVGVLHARGEAVPASGRVDIYDGYGNKTALSVGRDGNGVEVSGDLGPNFAAAIADVIYPVGSIFLSIDNTDPADRMAGTTWTQVSEGKFIGGVGTGTDTNGSTHTITAGDTDTTGEYDHTLTVSELPPHTHPIKNTSQSGNDSNYNRYGDWGNPNTEQSTSPLLPDNTGGGQDHNNIPPTFGVYVWQRTA